MKERRKKITEKKLEKKAPLEAKKKGKQGKKSFN